MPQENEKQPSDHRDPRPKKKERKKVRKPMAL